MAGKISDLLGEAVRCVALSAAGGSAAPAPARVMALRTAAFDAGAEGALPERFKIMGWGDNETLSGTVRVGAATLATLPGLQRQTGNDHVALDFEHSSHPEHTNYKGEPLHVAAYGSIEVVEGEGLFFNQAQWREKGREFAASYKDLSPVVHLDAEGNVLWVSSVALTRRGATPGLHFFSTDGKAATPAAPLVSLNKTQALAVNRDCLARLLALPDTATDEDINTALTSLEASMNKKTEPDPASEAKPLSVAEIKAAITEVVQPLSVRLDKMEADKTDSERTAIVTLAAQQGKKIPGWALSGASMLSNAQLRELVAGLAAGEVPLQRGMNPAITLPASGGSDTAAVVMKTLGITKEDWDKYDASGSRITA